MYHHRFSDSSNAERSNSECKLITFNITKYIELIRINKNVKVKYERKMKINKI
jgi:hypothetical protein